MSKRVWGLWDTEGRGGWLGSDDAPWTHADEDLARLAREVFAKRLGWHPLRIHVKRFRKGFDKPVNLGKPRMGVRRALQQLEAGL